MPDFQNFSITRNGNVNFSIPRFTITCDIVDSTHDNLIRSFNINFPNILNNFDNQQLLELFEEFIKMIIEKKLQNNVT